MRAMVLLLMLLGMVEVAQAWEFTLAPAQGRDGQPVSLGVAYPLGNCTPFGAPEVLREGSTVRVTFHINDSLPPICPPDRVSPRLEPLGEFATGNYAVEILTCANPPPPLPACAVYATLELSVFGVSGQRFTIPTLSAWAAIALATMLLLGEWARASRHQ